MDLTAYEFLNNKATYFKLKRDLIVIKLEPSFVFEMAYFKEDNRLKEELKEVVSDKPKKIERMANIDLNILKERLFRSLVNRDKYHTVNLANELMIRDKKSLEDILYSLSYISSDENKLIKTYMFFYLNEKIGYNPYILKNLIIYFTKSGQSYMNISDEKELEAFKTNVTPLYSYIYNLRKEDIKSKGLPLLELNAVKTMSESKSIILDKLKGGR